MANVGRRQLVTDSTAPTHAASSACVLGTSSRHLLYLVRPPVEASTARSVAFRLLSKAHRVAFTAAASLRGLLACARIRASRVGSFFRKIRISSAAFLWLQGWHAVPRLLMRFVPPLARGVMCSICNGTFSLSQ